MRVQIKTTKPLTIPFHALPQGDVYIAGDDHPEGVWMKVVGNQAVNLETGYMSVPSPYVAIIRREALVTVS